MTDAELADAVLVALEAVEDPEIPVTLKDLGVLQAVDQDVGVVHVRLLPTRLGCPGRDQMVERVKEAVARVDPDLEVVVIWDATVWRPSLISVRGQEALAEFGYALLTGSYQVMCPYCGSGEVRLEGEFGGSLCKAPYTCVGCGSTFDALRSAIVDKERFALPPRAPGGEGAKVSHLDAGRS